MNSFKWSVIIVILVLTIITGVATFLTFMPGSTPMSQQLSNVTQEGMVSNAALLRVPVTGIYPGGTTVGLNPDIQNPLANDPDAAQRGKKDFDAFNCSGCHMSNGGGGMGPSLSNNIWIYRESPGNIYLDIVQGRANGMPAWGAKLPDRTVWELVAYIQSISQKPSATFGSTTSVAPQTPDKEQIPAEQMDTTTPWQYTEPMPPNGERPGENPNPNTP